LHCDLRAYTNEESVLPAHIMSGPGAMHVCMDITFLGHGKYVLHLSDVPKKIQLNVLSVGCMFGSLDLLTTSSLHDQNMQVLLVMSGSPSVLIFKI
jgi:hypothetical protein